MPGHIEVKGLHVSYGDNEILKGINLTFPPGKVTAIIGPSGCGKTTLLRCLNRMSDLASGCRINGEILLDGEDIFKLDPVQLRRRVGMVFQKPNPFPKSLQENVLYGVKAMKGNFNGKVKHLEGSLEDFQGNGDLSQANGRFRSILDKVRISELKTHVRSIVHKVRMREMNTRFRSTLSKVHIKELKTCFRFMLSKEGIRELTIRLRSMLHRVFRRQLKTHYSSIVETSLKKAALWDEVKYRLGENAYSLSLGQQQRLCMARSLACSPEVILMDEPAASLDPISTAKLESSIVAMKGNFTVVIVTHNMQEALRIADYTAFLYMGELIEFGETCKLFDRPQKERTGDYIRGKFG